MSFPHCTACSKPIITELFPPTNNESPPRINLQLLERICSDSTILQDISGVNELTAGLDDIDLLDSDDF